MKINIGRPTGRLSIYDLVAGDIFQFRESITNQVYQMNDEGSYQSLKTGKTYLTGSCCEEAVVTRYPNATLDLGEAEGARGEEVAPL